MVGSLQDDTCVSKEPPPIKASSYILMDYASGAVMEGENIRTPLSPASMTKMMTALLLLDKIDSKKMTWQEKVPISARAAKVGYAHMDLQAGKPETVQDLFHAMIIHSANNATVALAEYAAISEEKFVAEMNQKAHAMGMKHTHFSNVTGLENSLYEDPPKVEGPHVASAYDLAILCRQLLQAHPDILSVSATPWLILGKEKTYPSRNEMLPGFGESYPGVDGLKTGYTEEAGYCFAGTAKREGFRLITVVMGTPSKMQRFRETAKLLDTGYNDYELKALVVPGETIHNIPIPSGVGKTLPVGVQAPVKMAVRRTEQRNYTLKVIPKKKMQAPISKGEVTGEVVALYKGKLIEGFQPVKAIANRGITKENWIYRLVRTIREMIASWFS